MIITSSREEIRTLSTAWKKAGESVALVPTMGCLHKGHLSLMKKARELGDRVIVSIFVNPIQFGPNEDFGAYPRQLERDCNLIEDLGVDAVFCPEADSMYDASFQTSVRVGKLSQGMCGADRPGHFDGVATVVSKLFNICLPDFGVFGEKDFQQLAIIRRMVRDLDFPVEIIGCPIVREDDGLAMSSRNTYIDGPHRQTALCLSKALNAAKRRVAESADAPTAADVIALAQEILRESGAAEDYVVVVNALSLEPETVVGPESVMAIAAKIDGRVRLIDNAKLM